MRHLFWILSAFLFCISCKQEENLPAPTAIHIKFHNQTGFDLEDLVVERTEIGDIGKGKSTSAYIEFVELGQQYGFALVESAATIKGKRYFSSAQCQGDCGTASAPDGVWLKTGYHDVSIHIAPPPGEYLDFRVK